MRQTLFAVAFASCTLAGCVTLPPEPTASSTLESRSASNVVGHVALTEHKSVVHARVDLQGLAPGSEHGFHIHDKGDCSAPDASSAGGHFNPAGVAHGRAGSAPHHAGDAGSVLANAKGEVHTELLLDGVTLASGPLSIVGRSLVVHRDRDDYSSQPAGNAGPRVACGVIVAP
ncbi:MAG: superoxide dismutase family protein [Proteobacteria bacterium]|nr:superoxide dismutase family protein [Pseudomonadota bacterium]